MHYGFVDIVELLLKYGAMVNVPGCDNITPLHEAVLKNELEPVKLLLMYGADPEAYDVHGRTPKYVIITSLYFPACAQLCCTCIYMKCNQLSYIQFCIKKYFNLQMQCFH